jgi:hypothetical protein
MATIAFDVEAFRAAFPAFADATTYPDDLLQGYWDTAIVFISDNTYGRWSIAQRTRALNLMTAHLAALGTIMTTGQTPGFVTSATIDKVSVSLSVPSSKTEFKYWLNLTPYGQQLAALMSMLAVGGAYYGGCYTPRGLR